MDEFQTTTQGRVPAEETLRRLAEGDKRFNHLDNVMNDLSTDLKLMKKDIQSICEKLDENKEEHREIIGKIDSFLIGCDNKYASKSVERILFWVGALIGAGIIGAILKTILK